MEQERLVVSSQFVKGEESKQCKHYETCSAPVCPLDPESIRDCIWYPDEPICRFRGQHNYKRMVINQHAINKRAKDSTTYYTAAMLNREFIIRGGISGVTPDMPIKEGEKEEVRWIADHPTKKKLGREEVEIRIRRIMQGRLAG